MNILKKRLNWLAVASFVFASFWNPVVAENIKAIQNDAWQDEQKTVKTLQTTADTISPGQNNTEVDGSALGMADIGKGVTMNLLKPLETGELSLGGLTIGNPVPDKYGQTAGELSTGSITTKGVFETHSGKDVSYTVYRNRVENYTGQAYPFFSGEVVQLHVGRGAYTTSRSVHVGSTRGMLLFLYGAPNAMMRSTGKDETLFFYTTTPQKNTRLERAIPGTYRPMREAGLGGAMAFTINNSSVTAIDVFAKELLESGAIPVPASQVFEANQLTRSDFSLRGFHINETFKAPATEGWKSKGSLWKEDFVEYPGVIVGYDKKNQISRVMAMDGTTFTPRGITLGDTRFLLLYMYGEPTRIVPNAAIFANEQNLEVYEYKNPYASSEYLAFAVDKESNFIKSILLSDRPVEKISALKNEQK